MNANLFITKDYEEKCGLRLWKNKDNSNPIKSKTNLSSNVVVGGPNKPKIANNSPLRGQIYHQGIIDKNARDWSRTSTTLRSLAPQASASAYSATRAYQFAIYYCRLTIYSVKHYIFDYATILTFDCQFPIYRFEKSLQRPKLLKLLKAFDDSDNSDIIVPQLENTQSTIENG